MTSKIFGEVLAGSILPAIGISSYLSEEFKTQEDYDSYSDAMFRGGLLGVFNHYSNDNDSFEAAMDDTQITRAPD